jgi:glutaminyl-peptide cyclotransferase
MATVMKRMHPLRPFVAVTMVASLAACTPDGDQGRTTPVPSTPTVRLPPTPLFDPDSAYAFVERQVAFGPRVPGSRAHEACGDWLVAKLQAYGATVTEQRGTVTLYTGAKAPLRNIIASWRPEHKERILLMAHWDTRAMADKDDQRRGEPIAGANDGGSGVGILLEVARHLADTTTGLLGVDILFTDVEDQGQPSGGLMPDEHSADTWCLGSQYFVKNPHVPDYTARFGILLDMVGARDALFYQEASSMQFAAHVVHKVWRTAAAIGHGDRFIRETRHFVGIDDHVPVNRTLRIPTIDIIEYDPSTRAFGPYWHTHDDNMEVIDRTTMNAVGRTVMEVVWKER